MYFATMFQYYYKEHNVSLYFVFTNSGQQIELCLPINMSFVVGEKEKFTKQFFSVAVSHLGICIYNGNVSILFFGHIIKT